MLNLSKRLKKKIQDVCGLNDLDRDERLSRAHEILNSQELKQAICNQILGTSFKDVERAMKSLIEDRRPTPEEEEMLELERIAPEKLRAEELFPKPKKQKKQYFSQYSPEEVKALMAASTAPPEYKQPIDKDLYHPTYTLEDTQAMLEGREDIFKKR